MTLSLCLLDAARGQWEPFMPGTTPITSATVIQPGPPGSRTQTRLACEVPASSIGNTWQAAPVIDLGALIGRSPHALDREAVARVLTGKRVLITGAGGSIGSHLAMVAAEFGPEQVVLMERAENALFEIDRRLSRRFPGVARRAMLHDVVDAAETRRLVSSVRPHVVFHAAAHKHVPLMEDHPAHAVINNVFGTRAIADAAVEAGAERFVMISSDKAVNPSSVMGATKRLAEVYVSHLGRTLPAGRTRMSMVRFGNVLGSACSVLTIWSSQIAEGGPVTVTDPRMTRYFMTIPEAAGLVIASATLDDQPSGGVYVLDMGEPIRIVDLAERFIRAHGYVPRHQRQTGQGTLTGSGGATTGSVPPVESLVELVGRVMRSQAPRSDDRSLDIVFTGTRPGEKIHEELAYAAESLKPSRHEGIRCWAGLLPSGSTMPDEGVDVARMLRSLETACETRDPGLVLAALRRIVPEFAQTNTK